MITNYFRSQDNIFTFNDRDRVDTERAFDLARAGDATVCVFKVPKVHGPWDKVAIVGHRLRASITFDVKRTKDTDRLYWLQEELRNLDREYTNAGRTQVAA